MDRIDVLVIGGGAAGLQAAISAKSTYPDKSVVLVRKEEKALIPCGIPYIFGSLESSEKNVLPDKLLTNVGVEIKIDTVSDIDLEKKVCTFSEGSHIYFEKLIFATGSIPTKPAWLKGADLDNVYTIPKNKIYLDVMHEKLQSLKRVVVVGAGFIGIEVSDELNKSGLDVTLVELEPTILSRAFDPEFGNRAEALLKERGVKVITGKGVQELVGTDGKVTSLSLSDGSQIEADAVILSMGYVPNVELARKSGLMLNELGYIKVCEYMRVNDCITDIYAIGDCAEKRDFLTGKLAGTMLASTACAEARIAGINLYQFNPCRKFSGTIAIYDTAIGDTAFGTAGITEARAIQEQFDVFVGSFTGIDTHPGALDSSHEQTVKLIVASDCGMILGGEVCGGSSTGELTNLIGVLIQNRVTIWTLLTTQIGTHPLLTGSPAGYPLIKAAEVVARRLKCRN
jgi:NADPH-dependent 2,4-dienoyl-CoA reductase/sulfur reductase-like enzyme